MDLDRLIARLLEFGRRTSSGSSHSNVLDATEIQALATGCREVFMSQPMLLQVSAPLKIAGDIHGQFQDLVRIFDLCGAPHESNYLFLGDYVDRGRHGIETIALLLAFKLKYRENFFLLRGNHECASVTRVYGFFDECKRRYSVKLWKTIVDTFNCMPIACVVDDKIFCAHGGLSPSLHGVDQIRKIVRPCEVPEQGVMCDLLWSDPTDDATGWSEGDRGVSFQFGPDVVSKFLELNDFDLICRAHQVVEDGYQFFAQRRLVTIFSAPNYVGEFDNAGAVMSVDDDLTCSFHVLRPMLKKPHL